MKNQQEGQSTYNVIYRRGKTLSITYWCVSACFRVRACGRVGVCVCIRIRACGHANPARNVSAPCYDVKR
jgi:hypothetical protein